MMPLTARDKQYIDDNMLTDEDFHFGQLVDELEVSYDGKMFESFSDELEMLNDETINSIKQEPEEYSPNTYTKNLINEIFSRVCESDFKGQQFSSHVPDIYSNDKEVSVITIPEVSDSIENTILADTPPHTPCGFMDNLPASPTNSCGEPVITSITGTGVSYGVPQNSQAIITSVNYKLSVQPNLESNAKVMKPITIIPKSGSNVVLTTQGPVEKVSKGMIQLRAPPNASMQVSKFVKTLNVQNDCKNNKSASRRNSVLSTSEICAAALKRQERIIKNRESAYLSRKRKKEYVMKLESELHQITVENSSLREENSRLKSKIIDLEKEISKLRATFSPKAMKKTVCLMVALFMLTFNFGPYSSIFQRSSPLQVKSDFPSHRIGRVLLWDESNRTTEERNASKSMFAKLKDISSVDDSAYIVDFDKTYNSSSCQHFINQTESLRLENDLLGWVERVEKKRKQTKMTKRRYHVESTLPNLASWSPHRMKPNQDIWARKKNKNEILIYETPRKAYEDFFDAIHRRDDTFYFVSFSGDHLLLPAIAHNKTLRPRMSFVMPAMTLNESVNDSDDHISMMQIDCEVMDTKLVYIKESVIPEHLRQKHNNTAKSNSKNSPEYSSYRHTRRLQPTNKLPPK